MLKQYKIPVPKINIQKNIIDIVDNAYKLKKEKEGEAKRLLDSIDGYLLDKLGIKVPARDTTLKNRIFTRKFSELSGDRFDCSYNQEYYKKLEKSLYLSKYPLMKIKQLFGSINETKLCNDNDRLYIEIGDIDIVTKEIMYTNKQKIVSSTIVLLENEDLLISTVRPTRGAIAIFNRDAKSYCSGAFCVLRHKKFSVVLLQYLLSSYIYKSLFEKYCSGSTYPTIKKDYILNLKIPVPPAEIQEKISNEILSRKAKALKLQNEARKLLEEAKYRVENIIFGERV